MTERDPEKLRRAVTDAAEMVKGLPDALQVAAFNKLFDAMIGTATATPPSTVPLIRRGASDPAPASPAGAQNGDTDRVAPLLSKIDRTSHPKIQSGRPVLDLALLALRAAAGCGQDWLTAAEVSQVLGEKFRLRIPDSSIRPSLGGAGRLVDRRRFGTGFEYRLMGDGEHYIESLGDLADDATRVGGRYPRGRPRRPTRPVTRARATRAETGEEAMTDTDAALPLGGTKDVAGSDETPRSPAPTKARSNRRVGPKAALEQLLDAGYFDQPRTIGDLASHLQQSRALTFASTDLSPTLVRLLRENKVDRVQNADKQYQYIRAQRN